MYEQRLSPCPLFVPQKDVISVALNAVYFHTCGLNSLCLSPFVCCSGGEPGVCMCMYMCMYYSVAVHGPAWRGTYNMLYKQHSLPQFLPQLFSFIFCKSFFLSVFSSCSLFSWCFITSGLPFHKAIQHLPTVYFDHCMCACVCAFLCTSLHICVFLCLNHLHLFIAFDKVRILV